MLKRIVLGILSLALFWVMLSYACGCAGERIIISTGDFNWRVYLSEWNFPGMQ